MRSQRVICVTLAALTVFGWSGCSDSDVRRVDEGDSAEKGPLVVYVTNYPLKYFAERIGGEHVDVRFPAPADVDPAYWMPDSETIREYQQADLILLNGAGYEKWVDAVSLPKSKLCDTSAEFTSEFIALEDAVTHSHGPEGEHAHGGAAFTTWLAPRLAINQADAICVALGKVRPSMANALRENFDALKSDLAALDREIASTVARASDRPVLFSHPVYQYLERRYGLRARSVHWEPNEAPTDAMWTELKGILAEHPAKWMIWEGEPNATTVKQLSELGLESIVFDPCGHVPAEGDYLAVQRQNVAALGNVYANSP